MPWTMKDALKKTKKATTPMKEKKWAAVANSVLKTSGDEGKAVRIANAVVKQTKPKKVKK